MNRGLHTPFERLKSNVRKMIRNGEYSNHWMGKIKSWWILFLYIFKHFRVDENPNERDGSFDSFGAFHDNNYQDEHHYNIENEHLPEKEQEYKEDNDNVINANKHPASSSTSPIVDKHLNDQEKEEAESMGSRLTNDNFEIGSLPALPSPTNNLWYIKDLQGKVHGPFLTTQMSAWYSEGQFPKTLMLKRSCDDFFYSLSTIKRIENFFSFSDTQYSSMESNLSMTPMYTVPNIPRSPEKKKLEEEQSTNRRHKKQLKEEKEDEKSLQEEEKKKKPEIKKKEENGEDLKLKEKVKNNGQKKTDEEQKKKHDNSKSSAVPIVTEPQQKKKKKKKLQIMAHNGVKSTSVPWATVNKIKKEQVKSFAEIQAEELKQKQMKKQKERERTEREKAIQPAKQKKAWSTVVAQNVPRYNIVANNSTWGSTNQSKNKKCNKIRWLPLTMNE